jgi:hypothetical protein
MPYYRVEARGRRGVGQERALIKTTARQTITSSIITDNYYKPATWYNNNRELQTRTVTISFMTCICFQEVVSGNDMVIIKDPNGGCSYMSRRNQKIGWPSCVCASLFEL